MTCQAKHGSTRTPGRSWCLSNLSPRRQARQGRIGFRTCGPAVSESRVQRLSNYCGEAALECGATGTALAGRGAASVRSVHSESGVSAVASPPHSKDRLAAISTPGDRLYRQALHAEAGRRPSGRRGTATATAMTRSARPAGALRVSWSEAHIASGPGQEALQPAHVVRQVPVLHQTPAFPVLLNIVQINWTHNPAVAGLYDNWLPSHDWQTQGSMTAPMIAEPLAPSVVAAPFSSRFVDTLAASATVLLRWVTKAVPGAVPEFCDWTPISRRQGETI